LFHPPSRSAYHPSFYLRFRLYSIHPLIHPFLLSYLLLPCHSPYLHQNFISGFIYSWRNM
jgi:hypothetical protein